MMRPTCVAQLMLMVGMVGAHTTNLDKLVDKLADQAPKAVTNLDDTTLGKPGHLAVRSGSRFTPEIAARRTAGPRGSFRVSSQPTSFATALQEKVQEAKEAIPNSVTEFIQAQKRRNELLREVKRQPSSQVGDITTVTNEFDPATKAYPKIDLNTPGLRVVNQEPPVYMVDDYLNPSECDALIDAAKSGDLESIKYNGRYVLYDHSRLWPIFPLILLSAIPQTMHISSSASHAIPQLSSLELVERYLHFLGPNALMVGLMLLVVPRIGEILAPYVTKDSGAEAKSFKWTGLDKLAEKSPGRRAHESILRRAEELCYARQTQFERVKVTRYQKGGGQAVHADAYAPPEPGKEEEYLAEGGQRLAQCLIYLNDVPKEDGGSTKFWHESVDLAVQPKKGSALIFFPSFEDGTEDTRMMHSGETYEGDGSKWTAGTWLHQTDIQPTASTGTPQDAR
jgi:hypothetical protein